jgi:hypothetical protein
MWRHHGLEDERQNKNVNDLVALPSPLPKNFWICQKAKVRVAMRDAPSPRFASRESRRATQTIAFNREDYEILDFSRKNRVIAVFIPLKRHCTL